MNRLLHQSDFCSSHEWIHPEQFRRRVQRYHGNHAIRNILCWDQFLAMSFARITCRDSLADIEVCLRSHPNQLYHMDFRSTVARSTLADAIRPVLHPATMPNRFSLVSNSNGPRFCPTSRWTEWHRPSKQWPRSRTKSISCAGRARTSEQNARMDSLPLLLSGRQRPLLGSRP